MSGLILRPSIYIQADSSWPFSSPGDEMEDEIEIAERVRPEDSGVYKCASSGWSEPFLLR